MQTAKERFPYQFSSPALVCCEISAFQKPWVVLIVSMAKSWNKCSIFFSAVKAYDQSQMKACVQPFFWATYLVFELSVECKLVFRFPIGYLVPPEPVNCGLEVTWLESPHITNAYISHQMKENNHISASLFRVNRKAMNVIYCSSPLPQGHQRWLQ